MMDWDKLRVFLAVAEAGSFTHAGESLSLSQSAVSRQIGALEDSLHVPLFHRHARGLILTEQGELLFRAAKEIFSKLAMAEAMLSESKERPKGLLKVTTTVAFGSTWLTPHMHDFLEAYPDITVSLVLDDAELDLSMRQADVALRLVEPRQPDLIKRHLVTFHFHLCASQAYARRHGTPRKLSDLHEHRLITYGEDITLPFPSANWILRAGGNNFDHRVVFRVNNFYAILRAVQSGIGIAALPDFMARQDPSLVRLLPEIEAPSVPAYFVYPEELRNSKRIAVLRDFLLSRVAQQEF